jgi:CRP/FNR family cyclic AMP-dependent transcriptional regulator
MFVMLSGRAKVQRADAEGKEVILAVLGPGEFFGEMSLIDEEPRSATVVTLDPCEFIAITKEAFQFLIAQNNEVCLRIMRSLVQRLREADRRIETEGYIESMPEGRLLLHERLRLLASS